MNSTQRACQQNAPEPDFRPRAFSLVEILAVMAVIVVLMALATPAMLGSLRASSMNKGARALIDQLGLARQTAASRSLSVEVRFYMLPGYGGKATDPASVFRAFQLFVIDETGNAQVLDKPEFLESPLLISSDTKASGFFKDMSDAASAQALRTPSTSGDKPDPKLPGFEWNYKYVAFRFGPSGSTNLKTGGDFVTLVHENGAPISQGANFFAIQVDPINGSVRSFRP